MSIRRENLDVGCVDLSKDFEADAVPLPLFMQRLLWAVRGLAAFEFDFAHSDTAILNLSEPCWKRILPSKYYGID